MNIKYEYRCFIQPVENWAYGPHFIVSFLVSAGKTQEQLVDCIALCHGIERIPVDLQNLRTSSNDLIVTTELGILGAWTELKPARTVSLGKFDSFSLLYPARQWLRVVPNGHFPYQDRVELDDNHHVFLDFNIKLAFDIVQAIEVELAVIYQEDWLLRPGKFYPEYRGSIIIPTYSKLAKTLEGTTVETSEVSYDHVKAVKYRNF